MSLEFYAYKVSIVGLDVESRVGFPRNDFLLIAAFLADRADILGFFTLLPYVLRKECANGHRIVLNQ